MSSLFFGYAFGELEISGLTAGVLIGLTLITFASVAVSTMSLIKFGSGDED